jgi:transcription elongation factor Elf1
MTDSREPIGSTKEPRPKSPTALTRFKCPNCGRDPAVVFAHIREYDRSVKDAPLVCLECFQSPGRS